MIARPGTSALLVDQYGKPMALSGAWAGTRQNRTKVRPWANGVAGSADEDILDDLPRLRARSRQLTRDNALAAGAISVATKHVVGTGLSMRSEVDREVLGWKEEKATGWQLRTNRLFDMWCRSKACDITLEQDFWELQDLALRTTLESGDALANFCWREHPSSPWATALQVIEGDRICNKDGVRDTKTLTGGVRLDKWGAARAYDVRDQHPGSRLGVGTKGTWTTLPAFSESGRRICQHLFVRTRPDQHRGVPYLSVAIEPLKDLGEFTDGELRAAVVSGLYTGIITSPAALDENGSPLPPAESTDEFEMGYGAVVSLEPGEDIKTTAPGRPNAAFDPFVLAVLRQIGVSLEIPYAVLIQHFTENYSAARAALLELAKFVRRRRAWLAAHFCQPAYEAWLEEAIYRGDVEGPGFFEDPLLRMAYCGASWIGDAMGQVDPLKEVNAWKVAVDETFATKDQATSALFGGDHARNVETRGREIAMEKKAGIAPPPPKGFAKPQNQAGPDQKPAKPQQESK